MTLKLLLPSILGTALFGVGVLSGSFCLREVAPNCDESSPAPSALRAAIDRKGGPETKAEAEPNSCTVCGETNATTTTTTTPAPTTTPATPKLTPTPKP
ncbi:MAG: hypothetical protein H0T76_06680 [Nannocystis sp.]|nr:hypothetical protein [Nannocystis sp.]MBA3546147.1 hypothetical protein [Nannocystis sp.]